MTNCKRIIYYRNSPYTVLCSIVPNPLPRLPLKYRIFGQYGVVLGNVFFLTAEPFAESGLEERVSIVYIKFLSILTFLQCKDKVFKFNPTRFSVKKLSILTFF